MLSSCVAKRGSVPTGTNVPVALDSSLATIPGTPELQHVPRCRAWSANVW